MTTLYIALAIALATVLAYALHVWLTTNDY